MHEGKWKLVIDENHDAMLKKCIKVQSVSRMGKCAQNKMEMFSSRGWILKNPNIQICSKL